MSLEFVASPARTVRGGMSSRSAIRHIVAMCGISGAVSTTPGLAGSAVEAQLACQRHRGPDAEGHFGGGAGVIAQNRLSIIDLVQGDPPITNEDGTVGVVLNGEIYNFRELRAELYSARPHASRAMATPR